MSQAGKKTIIVSTSAKNLEELGAKKKITMISKNSYDEGRILKLMEKEKDEKTEDVSSMRARVVEKKKLSGRIKFIYTLVPV